MVIQVNPYQKIRMYYEQEHRHIRWTARELGCSQDTVRKYIIPRDCKSGSGRRNIMLDEVDFFIDMCFAEDVRENLQKQKHTAKRIHDRIQKELGIEIQESTVRTAVARKLAKQKPVFILLAFVLCRLIGAVPKPISPALRSLSATKISITSRICQSMILNFRIDNKTHARQFFPICWH